MQTPKVIIVGETFRLNGGGGITMSNLFKEWPKENIGVITSQIDETNPSTGYRYYQLGNLEIKFPFPFNVIQKKIQSGEYIFLNQKIQNNSSKCAIIIFRLKSSLRKVFDYMISILGLSYKFYSIRLSDQLINWIKDFGPDVIYIQPFLHKTMRFGNLLYETLKIQYVIHIMDDSVNYVNRSIVCRRTNQGRINSDFQQLVLNARSCMCISEAMAKEYWHRYHRRFVPFRNPVEVDEWLPFVSRNLMSDSNVLRIIYTGRLFSPTINSLIDMCKIVDKMSRNGYEIEFHIYTHDINKRFFKMIKKMQGVNLFAPVAFDKIPQLISTYDIFYLCLDFDERALRYSQYSISTRTSEGMISGVPILLYAPANTALYKYFENYEAGLLIEHYDEDLIEQSILKLWKDKDFRKKISSNAINQVLQDSDAKVVRERFRKFLLEEKWDEI